jgi:hypothetical protein
MTKQTLHTSRQGGALFRALLILATFLSSLTIAVAYDDPPSNVEREAFLSKVSQIAKAEQSYSGIPASIKAAQAIFESSWGKSRLATTGNNYFGIKCKSWWTGETILHQDDDFDEEGNLTFSCFRAYESVEESFEDHTIFLLSSDRYASLFKLDPTDYKGWAHGLKKCGYATDPNYAQKIIGLIERLNLQELDQPTFVLNEPVVQEASLIQATPQQQEVNPAFRTAERTGENTPPPPTRLPDGYVPSGKGERPTVRKF